MDGNSSESDDTAVLEMTAEEQRAHAVELRRQRQALVRNLRNRRRQALRSLQIEISEREQEMNVIETRRQNLERRQSQHPGANGAVTGLGLNREETREQRAERILEEVSDDDMGYAPQTQTFNVAMFQRMRKKEAAERELKRVEEDIARVQQERKDKVDDLQDKGPLYNRFPVRTNRDGGDRERLKLIRVLTNEIKQFQRRYDELQVVLRRLRYELSDEDSLPEEKADEKGEGEGDEEEEEEEDDDLHVMY